MYGGSHRLMERIYTRFGLKFSFVDSRDIRNIEAALRPETRMIYCETPTNPMMQLTDLSAVGDLTQAHGFLFAVDNTFATPIFQRPLEVGADVVLHSTTKYLNGHSDMVGGLLLTRRDDLAEQFGFIQNAAGAVPGPMDCFLALRGTKTLPLRMRQQTPPPGGGQWLPTEDVQRCITGPSSQHELARGNDRVGGAIRRRRRRGTRAPDRGVPGLSAERWAAESLMGHPPR
jgi:O-acetylhomoserine/O-acetylserine sulfhydrylase-like pyridoxal-dependent enzyme